MCDENKIKKDLMGLKFGKLTPISVERRDGTTWWRCKCDCGQEKEIPRGKLVEGSTSHCGCYRPMVKQDIINHKFGKLKAIEFSHINERGDALWKCLCDCGRESIVSRPYLKRGMTTSCGCDNKKDLTNRRFGQLKVIEKSHKDGDYTYWLCLCDCGNLSLVKGFSLNSGNTKSCGHNEDLTGERFGKLLVLSFSHRDAKSISYYNCRCDCGNEKIICGTSVKYHTRSCGCLKLETHTTHGQSRGPYYKEWCNRNERCHNPNRPGFQDYGARGIYVCDEWRSEKYGGLPENQGLFNYIKWCEKNPKPSSKHSLDRIDNNGPYSPENYRWANSEQQAANKRRRISNFEHEQLQKENLYLKNLLTEHNIFFDKNASNE